MTLSRRDLIAAAAWSLSTPWPSVASSAPPPMPRVLGWNGKIVWKAEGQWRVVGPGGSTPLRVNGLTSVLDLASGGGTSWAAGTDGAGHLAIARAGTTFVARVPDGALTGPVRLGEVTTALLS